MRRRVRRCGAAWKKGKGMETKKKEILSKTWHTLIRAYKDTVEYTSHGATGDPRKTIDKAMEEGATFDDLRQALAVIAHIKEHDGRFSRSNRQWLYESLDFDAGDWYIEYGRFMGGVDDIHTTHLDNLTSCLRTKYLNTQEQKMAERLYGIMAEIPGDDDLEMQCINGAWYAFKYNGAEAAPVNDRYRDNAVITVTQAAEDGIDMIKVFDHVECYYCC